MIGAVFEIIFSFVVELVVEIVGEVLVEFGFHSAAEKLSARPGSKLILGGAYSIFGMVIGALSLFVFPKILFANRAVPIAYFIISPVIAGFALSVVSWFIDQGTRKVSWFELDKFSFGVLFALGYSLSRLIVG